MGLSDVTGVLSRYFVVGFFLPAYVTLIALWLSASSGFLPNSLEGYEQGTQLLILGGVGLVVALALSGLNYQLIRLFEGYWLPPLGAAVIGLQRRSYDKLKRVVDDETKPLPERARALCRMDQRFPASREKLLPTRLGNAIRAFERHSNTRWGLDGVTIWPRIDALLGSDERELHIDARIDLNVFLNAGVGALVVGICLAVDKAVYGPGPDWNWPLYAIPFLAAYALYRATIGPAIRWGEVARASIDLHRLEMYEKLGVREPTSFSDERAMATPINQLLLYGEPHLEDRLWRRSATEQKEDHDQHTWLGKLVKDFEEAMKERR